LSFAKQSHIIENCSRERLNKSKWGM